jgi:hypothetical protein
MAKRAKRIKNREQLLRATNQNRDPATGRFIPAPGGVVVREPSASTAGVGGRVPDVPPGFEGVIPNRSRTGGSTFPPSKPKVRFHTFLLFFVDGLFD